MSRSLTIVRTSPAKIIRAAIWPAIAVLVIGNFAAYAVAGPNGLIALGDYRQQLAHRQVELARLQRSRAVLAHRVALLDQRHTDPDLADELVRRELGLARADEVILQTP